ncbi:MAG: hypothetical protein AB8I08_13180 [Sandaracinaceae bacterium]
MAYRDDMEAARRRVEALEEDLRQLTVAPRTEGGPSDEAYARIVALAEALEDVQQELQRRRREHDELFRRAALSEVRRHELSALSKRCRDAETQAERERKRADYAEIALMRTQMRLSIERARHKVEGGWPASSIRHQRDEVRDAVGAKALDIATDRMGRLEQLTLLVADILWNPPTDPAADREALLATLRRSGHALVPRGDRRYGPRDPDAVGLRITLGPLALRVAYRAEDGTTEAVTLADDGTLTRARSQPDG